MRVIVPCFDDSLYINIAFRNYIYSIEYGKIDLSTGKSSEFRTLGDLEKKKYYLYDKHNRIQIGDYIYFFSETPNGDRLLVSRMDVNQ